MRHLCLEALILCCYFAWIQNHWTILVVPCNCRRYMKFARVMDVNHRRQICTRDKVSSGQLTHSRSPMPAPCLWVAISTSWCSVFFLCVCMCLCNNFYLMTLSVWLHVVCVCVCVCVCVTGSDESLWDVSHAQLSPSQSLPAQDQQHYWAHVSLLRAHVIPLRAHVSSDIEGGDVTVCISA